MITSALTLLSQSSGDPKLSERGRSVSESPLKPEVTKDQFVARQMVLQSGFKPTIVLHAIGERIADDGDMVAGLQLELLC
jgi:hypothetical protein